jgi:hypothetical protein
LSPYWPGLLSHSRPSFRDFPPGDFGGRGNVFSTDNISSIEMTTLAAQKDSTNKTITSIDMPALRARPARLARIDGNDWHPYQLRLVLNKSTQFTKRPFRHLASPSFPEPCPVANPGQIFQTDPASGVCSLLNDLLGDFVVLVCLKPPFSPRRAFNLRLAFFGRLPDLFCFTAFRCKERRVLR